MAQKEFPFSLNCERSSCKMFDTYFLELHNPVNYHLISVCFLSRRSCWLRDDIAFYVGVVAYFLLIFSLCLLVFILVMVQLARIKKQNPQNQSPNRGVMTDVRSIAGLVILLGLTWGFALFAWGPLYLPFVYLFTIFNTLQGEILGTTDTLKDK